jgi:hypothetical protein
LSVAPGALPGRLRLASILSVLVSGTCGLFSAWDGFGLWRLADLKEAPSPFPLDAVLAEQLWAAQVVALGQMREPRMVVLFALALVCSLTFVASARLLRPAGLSREAVRKILVWALVLAAALRTMDGAQSSVIARSAAEVLRRGLPLPDTLSVASAEELRGLVTPTVLLASALQTLLVVGPFLFLSQYFRSPRVKAWAAQADARGLA